MDTFPSNKSEALAMLYLQNQDLTGKTPTEIKQMYSDVLHEFINAKVHPYASATNQESK